MLFITFGEQNHFRYRPPKQPQHDLALIKVKKPIIFSSKIMPICLPPGDKFPDEKGVVYAAGWRQKETKTKDCTTGDKGPDPFSKCKFPFFMAGLIIPFNQCLLSTSPSQKIKGCRSIYKLMKKRKGNTISFLDENYRRVITDTYNIKSLIRKLMTVLNCKFYFWLCLAYFSYHVLICIT